MSNIKHCLVIIIGFLSVSCGPKYIYKPNGVPVISCAYLDNSEEVLSIPVAAECLNKNMPLLKEIYAYERKDNEALEASFEFQICISEEGKARVGPDAPPPKSQLEKFTRSFLEHMDFPKSREGVCFSAPFKFIIPE